MLVNFPRQLQQLLLQRVRYHGNSPVSGNLSIVSSGRFGAITIYKPREKHPRRFC